MVFDAEMKSMLHIEMAKKNPFVIRGNYSFAFGFICFDEMKIVYYKFIKFQMLENNKIGSVSKMVHRNT